MIKPTAGFSLIELLVILAFLGAILAVGAYSLQGYRHRLDVQNDLLTAAQTVKYALATVRKDNRSVTLQVDARTLRVKRGTDTLRTVTLVNTPTLTCSGTCPTSNTFTLAAPYGLSAQDFSLTIARSGLPQKTLLVRGPAALVGYR